MRLESGHVVSNLGTFQWAVYEALSVLAQRTNGRITVATEPSMNVSNRRLCHIICVESPLPVARVMSSAS